MTCPNTVVDVDSPKPQAGRAEANSRQPEASAESAEPNAATSAAARPRTLTVRIPRLRRPRLSLPFALVQAEPDLAAQSSAGRERAARLRERAGRAFARL